MLPSEQGKIPTRTAVVQLTVHGRNLKMKFDVPEILARPAQALPLFRNISASLVNYAVQEVAKQGQTVSCKKGCGVCCRQLVPISALEAREIAKLVNRMPEPRRTEIRERFQNALKGLDQAGMLPRLRDPEAFDLKDTKSMDIEYFALRIPCPFLEDESCSIYEDRPITCREFLVVSPPEHCAEPTPVNVKSIPPLAGPVAMGIPTEDRTPSGLKVMWVPLIMSLEYAAAHSDEPPARPASELVEALFARLNNPRAEMGTPQAPKTA